MPETLSLNPQADDQKLLAQVVDFYHRSLKETTEGLAYLRSRGVTVSEAIDRFRIGYANRTLGLKLPNKQVSAGKKIRSRLQQLGVMRSSGHEHFNGCVTFPITTADGSGRIVDVYGRKIGGHRLRKGTPLDMHLSEQRCGVWNVEGLSVSDQVILCSSLFDALAFWNAGYRYVTCTIGPDALTDDHMNAFREFGIKQVLLTEAALAQKLTEAGWDCYLLTFPAGMGANKYALDADDPSRALGSIIRKAEWLGKGQNRVRSSVSVAEVFPSTVESSPVAAPVETEPIAADLETAVDEPVDNDVDDDQWEEIENDLPDDELDPIATDEEPAPPILTASPVPPPPQDIEANISGDEVTMQLGHRHYRVRGLSKNLSFDQMKVNVLASTERGLFVDSFDLYIARHRRQFVIQAAIELGVNEQTIKKDLGRVLLKLEELQDEQIDKIMQPKEPAHTMTPEEKEEALRLLRDPKLLERIVADFDVVGETTNKLVGYLAAVSRKLDQPLAIIIQSSSAAGKTSLMDAILALVPPEDQVKFSAMTGQSLYYMGETDLKHKVLALVEEEGAERASYALKLLQSEGALTIASTGKDSSTGRLITQEYRVEGPTALFLTTTAIKIDEELLNRCIVLSVDENREQTKAIHQFQRHRQTLAGLLADHDRQQTLALHRNAQRLLRPLLVANPYAESLTFLDDKTRTRRDHLKYLTLIRAIALLHQYQRPIKTTVHHERTVEYIEATLEDIAVANRLACEALGRSVDELPPQTRRLLALVYEMVTTACQQKGIDRADHRFSRRDIREFTDWGHTQLKVHIKRLEELEYLLVHRGGRGQSFVYELLYDPPPDSQSKFLARLSDVEQLKHKYDGTGRGGNAKKSGSGRPQAGVKSGRSRGRRIDASADGASVMPPKSQQVNKNANLDREILTT